MPTLPKGTCTFFVEENFRDKAWRPTSNRGKWLWSLFTGSSPYENISLAEYLALKNHRIALALITLDDATAKVVRLLNGAGVKVHGWILLPEDQGYWSNPANLDETCMALDRFLEWQQHSNLVFERLGIDWEIPIQAAKALSGKLGKRMYPHAYANYRKALRRGHAKRRDLFKRLQSYLNNAKSVGIGTELYTLPWFANVLFGLRKQPQVDQRVLMNYGTALPLKSISSSVKLLRWGMTYAVPAHGLVSGIKGSSPGRDFGTGLPRHLSVAELSECIRTAGKVPSYLFALNHYSVVQMWEDAFKEA